MNEWIEIAAKTVEEAITEASLQLGTSSDNMKLLNTSQKVFLECFQKRLKLELN